MYHLNKNNSDFKSGTLTNTTYMNRKIIQLLVLAMMPIALFAQKKDVRLNVGLPIGKYGKFDHSFGGADETNSPSILIQVEKNWQPDLSVGAYIGYAGQKHEYGIGSEEVKFNHYRVGLSLTYELEEFLNDLNLSPGYGIEMYTSVKSGFTLEHKKNTFSNIDNGGNPIASSNSKNDILFDLGIALGSRYYLSDQFGLFCELGWGNAGFFTIGTTFNL